jgi:Ca2+-binding RTX toxin-like protein
MMKMVLDRGDNVSPHRPRTRTQSCRLSCRAPIFNDNLIGDAGVNRLAGGAGSDLYDVDDAVN